MDDGAVVPDLGKRGIWILRKNAQDIRLVIVDILEKENNIQGALKVLLTMCEQGHSDGT